MQNLSSFVKQQPKKYSQQRPTVENKTQQRNSERVRHIIKIFKPSRKVTTFLDIGCGNAEITQEIAKTFKIDEVYGADIFDEKDFKAPKSTIVVNYKQVINNKINLPDHSVDFITCNMSIHHFEDFKQMMSEICRILKPKGWLFFREHDVPLENLELKDQLNKMHEEYPDHPGGNINYWPRETLKEVLVNEYRFKHLADSDYPPTVKNKQAIYHSLFLKLLH